MEFTSYILILFVLSSAIFTPLLALNQLNNNNRLALIRL
jgi:hypothetical protein